jgi:hypothetical protein
MSCCLHHPRMQAPSTPSILIPAGPSMAGSSILGHTHDLSASTASLSSPHQHYQQSGVLGSPYGFGPQSPGSMHALGSPMFPGGHSSMHAPSRLSGAPMFAPLPTIAPGGSDGGFNAAPSMTSVVHRTASLPSAYGFHAASPGSGTLSYAMQVAPPSPGSGLGPAGGSLTAMRGGLEPLRSPSPVSGEFPGSAGHKTTIVRLGQLVSTVQADHHDYRPSDTSQHACSLPGGIFS